MDVQFYRESLKNLTYEELKRNKKIRELNDRLRKTMPRAQDVVLIVGSLKDEPPALQMLAYNHTRAFTGFTEDNDPYGEHDCASFEVEGKRFLFKIDYYDHNLQFHSPDPSDPDLTRRVLSIMYASDY
jgi:hypothetical protein